MAKATLPVNFQDDIMSASMNGKRRYNLIQNADGTVSLEDVTNYDQVGSNFGAGQINQTNTAVNASADAGKIIDSLATIKATTAKGYMAGALAVKELNNKLANGRVEIVVNSDKSLGFKLDGADTVFPFRRKPVTVATIDGWHIYTNGNRQSKTFDVDAQIPYYKTLTADDFFITTTKLSGGTTDGVITFSKSYNANTGVLTISADTTKNAWWGTVGSNDRGENFWLDIICV